MWTDLVRFLLHVMSVGLLQLRLGLGIHEWVFRHLFAVIFLFPTTRTSNFRLMRVIHPIGYRVSLINVYCTRTVTADGSIAPQVWLLPSPEFLMASLARTHIILVLFTSGSGQHLHTVV